MAEFLVPVREGKDDFGTVKVRVPELEYQPEVAFAFRYERGGLEEFRGWAGKLWLPLRGPGRKPVTKDALETLASSRPDPNPFSGGNWSNPFQPDRNSFSRDPRRANPFEGKRMRKEAKQAIRLKEVEQAATNLAIMGDGIVHRSVDAPQIHVMVNPGKTVHLQVALPDNDGFVEPGQWNAFRADRIEDARTFALALAERDGLEVIATSGHLDTIFPDPFIHTNDVVDPAMDALGRFVGFAERFADTLPPVLLDKAKEAKDYMAGSPDLHCADDADSAYDLVREAAGLLRGITTDGNSDMIHEATLWVCDTAVLRYETVDREWLRDRNLEPGPQF